MSVRREQAKDIFLQVLEAPKAQRQARLEQACGGDVELLADVRALLNMHSEAVEFMAAPTLASADAGVTTDKRSELPPGTQVGPYEIVALLGQGGFGEVYKARQSSPVRRMVALKVVKLGMNSAEIVARFETERQALAMMDHPGIATVFDAGTTEAGRPYFVMELVDGLAITEFSATHRLTIHQRIDLFFRVCAAIQHAHQKGIIHRDLKPNNVLVLMKDDKPFPKIIDFGIAKAAQPSLSEWTDHTRHGQLVGTPAYMSPEQADMTGLNIDTRSDVYSLGVLLYELFTGRTALDLSEMASIPLAEVQRIIREQEPLRPSARVLKLGDELSQAARNRRTTVERLALLLRGDIDWIVLKALEKDRSRRYGSVAELAADLSRYLERQPINARPPTASYRISKFVRRHWAAVCVAVCMAVVLIMATVVSTFFALSEARQRRAADEAAHKLREEQALTNTLRAQAEHERDTAVAALNFLNVDLLSSVIPSVEPGEGRNISMREVLDEASRRIELRSHPGGPFADKPLVEASVRVTLGAAYHDLGVYAEAERHLLRGYELRSSQLGPDHDETLEVLSRLGPVYLSLNRPAEAERFYRESVDRHERVFGPDHPDTLGAFGNLGSFLGYQGHLKEAEPYCRRVLAGRRAALGDDHEHTLVALGNLATLLTKMDRTEEAARLSQEALAGYLRTLGPKHPHTLKAMSNAGSILGQLGRYEESERILSQAVVSSREIYGTQHDATAVALNNHAQTLKDLGRLEEARSAFREALEIHRSVLGDGHPNTIIAMSNLAGVLRDVDLFEQAFELSREAVERSASTFPADHWISGQLSVRHAESLLGLSRFAEARVQAEGGYAIIERALGPGSSRARDAAGVVVRILESWHEAEPHAGYDQSVRVWRDREAAPADASSGEDR